MTDARKIMSESHILGLLATYFPEKHPALLLGRGDDCAVWKMQGALCVSTDLFLEDVHFRRSYFKAEEVGHKALAVNISDVAGMGVRPLAFTLGLGVPPYADLDWLEGFFSGMGALAAHHRMTLVGGDLSRAPAWHICITVWGEPATSLHNPGMARGTAASLPGTGQSGGSYLMRGGAMPGDSIFVVGQPGLARVGLSVLEALGHEARQLWPAACAAHLRPLPQVDAGLLINRAGASSRPPVLMDVSDGLARDLPRLLGMHGNPANARGLGAQIVLPEALLPAEVIRHAREHGLCPATEAWLGGEDYALLGACVPDLLPALHAALPQLISIGVVTEGGGLWCNAQQMDMACEGMGFDHFSLSSSSE